jgi:hypothetical protein
MPGLARRRFPLLATAGLLVAGMVATTCGAHLVSEWGGQRAGGHGWALPPDLWGTLAAAHRLVHLEVSGLYTPPTALVTFPGAALILVPVAAVIDAMGLGLGAPGGHNPHPGAWLLAGPYEIALSSVALFAADAGAARRRWRGCSGQRLAGLGAPRGRGGGRVAAVCHPRALRLPR